MDCRFAGETERLVRDATYIPAGINFQQCKICPVSYHANDDFAMEQRFQLNALLAAYLLHLEL